MNEQQNNQSFLPYLNLLQEHSPGEVLQRFSSLIDENSAVAELTLPEDPGDLHLDRHVDFSDGASADWRAFLDWWVEQFHRELARKFDSLTGLYTRSHWKRELRFRMKETVGSACVLLADIDHFKHFNDRYGHGTGDRVLSAVGDLLRDVFEPSGTCVRYGGEELLVIDSGSPESVLDRARTFRENVQQDLFEDQPEPVTVSQGVSPPDTGDRSLEERIEEADLALYAAKNRGRNRVTNFAPYMRHRESLSVWGFYRYFWGGGLRFCFGADDGTFYLYYDGALTKYRWSDDSAVTIDPPEYADGVRELLFRQGHLHLLDGEGVLWVGSKSGWRRIAEDDLPPLITLLEAGDELLAAATNNQLYRIEVEQSERVRGLPESWERLVFLGQPMIVVDGQLRTLENPPRVWDLPEAYVDFTSENEELVMSSPGGNLYVFDGKIHHWKELRLPDFLNHRVSVRNVERTGDDLLVHDENGRFFLVSRKNKSVPQKMSLGL